MNKLIGFLAILVGLVSSSAQAAPKSIVCTGKAGNVEYKDTLNFSTDLAQGVLTPEDGGLKIVFGDFRIRTQMTDQGLTVYFEKRDIDGSIIALSQASTDLKLPDATAIAGASSEEGETKQPVPTKETFRAKAKVLGMVDGQKLNLLSVECKLEY